MEKEKKKTQMKIYAAFSNLVGVWRSLRHINAAVRMKRISREATMPIQTPSEKKVYTWKRLPVLATDTLRASLWSARGAGKCWRRKKKRKR